MTMDIYAQLQQLAKRDHGVKLDELIKESRALIEARPSVLPKPSNWSANWSGVPNTPSTTPPRSHRVTPKTRQFAGNSLIGATDLSWLSNAVFRTSATGLQRPRRADAGHSAGPVRAYAIFDMRTLVQT
jgi:hypothetical protein